MIKGSIVKCVWNGKREHDLTKDKEYVVITESNLMVEIKSDRGILLKTLKERFEKL